MDRRLFIYVSFIITSVIFGISDGDRTGDSSVTEAVVEMNTSADGHTCKTNMQTCSIKMAPKFLKGDQGPKGERGIDGIDGKPGSKGEPGEQGKDGLKGESGVKGEIGQKGLSGPQGVSGPKGDVGIQGPQGAPGLEGAKGSPGKDGLKGETGTKGEVGLPGPQGLKGLMGDVGVQGQMGPPGPIGETGGPGKDGMKGEPGEKGDKGSTGLQGPPGLAGDKGAQGFPGLSGLKGEKGSPGKPGTVKSADELEDCTPTELSDESDVAEGRDEYRSSKKCPLSKLCNGYADIRPGTYQTGPPGQIFEVSCVEEGTCLQHLHQIKITDFPLNNKSFWLSEKAFNLNDFYGVTPNQIEYLQSMSSSVTVTINFNCMNSHVIRKNSGESLRLLLWNDIVIGPEPTEDSPLHYTVEEDGCNETTDGGDDEWSSAIISVKSIMVRRLPIIDFYIRDTGSKRQRLKFKASVCFN